MKYYNRLSELRGKTSQEKFAKPLGLSQQNYGNYERGEQSLNSDLIIKVCETYGCTAEWLLGLDQCSAIKPVADNSLFVDVPVFGSIAAGDAIEMIEVEETFPVARSIIEKYDGFNPDGAVTLFLLRVEGESMNRVLPNGCLALIKPTNVVDRDGKPYAVCVNGFSATIKRVHKLNNGFELVPDSTDPTYTTQIFNYNEPGTETITVIGRVAYYVLPFDWGF